VREKREWLPFVYIKRWAKSDQAIAFRLNNKVVQVNFNDKSQLILYSEKDVLLYSNSQAKEKVVMDIGSPEIRKNAELAQRFDHAKLLMRKLARTGCMQPDEGVREDHPLQVDLLHS
jgi:polo-like kinase 1